MPKKIHKQHLDFMVRPRKPGLKNSIASRVGRRLALGLLAKLDRGTLSTRTEKETE